MLVSSLGYWPSSAVVLEGGPEKPVESVSQCYVRGDEKVCLGGDASYVQSMLNLSLLLRYRGVVTNVRL